jgi:two-component system nitrogen regulation response regulator GlnG
MLVIDDEDAICLAFERFFQRRGWSVRTAAAAAEGRRAYEQAPPDIVFLDVRLPDRSGLELLEDLAGRGAAVVVITAYGGLETVVRALKGKAYDYLAKPIDLDKALSLANRVLAERVHEAPAESAAAGRGLLVGTSPAMQEAYKLIARAAGTTSPVLIQGETGTGKELAAVAIYQFSPRSNGPFVAINCGAIPEHLIESELFGHVRGAFTGADADRAGRFEAADGGSLLLDEIGDLPLPVQVKLLRVLDGGTIERVGSSKPVGLDVRIIAAANRELGNEVRSGRFRRDLYYRLAVLRITMPTLRDRREDIPVLAEHFLRRLTPPAADPPPSLGADAVEAMLRHDWPGNVRELKNAVDHALAVAPDRTIRAGDLPESVRAGGAAPPGEDRLHDAVIRYATRLPDDEAQRHHRTLAEVERAMIRHAMKRHHGNQSEAAAYLGLHRNTLRNKLRELHIRPDDYAE